MECPPGNVVHRNASEKIAEPIRVQCGRSHYQPKVPSVLRQGTCNRGGEEEGTIELILRLDSWTQRQKKKNHSRGWIQPQMCPKWSFLVDKYDCKCVLDGEFVWMNARGTASFQYSSDEHKLAQRSITDCTHNIFVFTKGRSYQRSDGNECTICICPRGGTFHTQG